MKKLFTALVVFILTFALFAFPALAEGEEITAETPEILETETTAPEEIPDAPDNSPVSIPNAPENEILEQILGFISNGEIWGKIGATVLSVFALIFSLRSILGKIHDGIIAVTDFISGKATKEETETAINTAVKGVIDKYEEKHKELTQQNAELSAKYDKMSAILSLTVLQLVKSPNARVKIMELIADTNKITEDVAELVEEITEEIAEADAATPKADTPALDAIVKEHTENDIIRLG